jgi:hypothetical protein
VRVSRLLHPLAGLQKVWNGKANLGVLEISGSAGRIEGTSLRLYDPASHAWSFTFAGSSDGTLGPPMTGGFERGRGVF